MSNPNVSLSYPNLDGRYALQSSLANSISPTLPLVSRSVAVVIEPAGSNSYSYGARIRPVEKRKYVRVVNIGVNPFRLGYVSQADNVSYNGGNYIYTVAAGQEFIDTSGNPSALYLSDANSTTQALSALIITETYL